MITNLLHSVVVALVTNVTTSVDNSGTVTHITRREEIVAVTELRTNLLEQVITTNKVEVMAFPPMPTVGVDAPKQPLPRVAIPMTLTNGILTPYSLPNQSIDLLFRTNETIRFRSDDSAESYPRIEIYSNSLGIVSVSVSLTNGIRYTNGILSLQRAPIPAPSVPQATPPAPAPAPTPLPTAEGLLRERRDAKRRS